MYCTYVRLVEHTGVGSSTIASDGQTGSINTKKRAKTTSQQNEEPHTRKTISQLLYLNDDADEQVEQISALSALKRTKPLSQITTEVSMETTTTTTLATTSTAVASTVSPEENSYPNTTTVHDTPTETRENSTQTVQELRQTIKRLEEENARLRSSLKPSIDIAANGKPQGSNDIQEETGTTTTDSTEGANNEPPSSTSSAQHLLSREQIERYSRQLLLRDGFGVVGQQKLLSSSVLIIGAGGIGSTVILYLAASGVGKLTIVDFDAVEISNLHRQVIHSSCNVGMNKAESARRAVRKLNPSISCTAIQNALNYDNAMELVSQHDCVVDASDNPQTRYLVNDACVLSSRKKDTSRRSIPLISGSAMGTEGQLTVYNYMNGPCYRCLYPQPNPTEGCKSCSDNGVLGPVPGLIGILQSLETIKVLTDNGVTMHDRLVMYDSLRCSFLSVKKPPKQTKCPVCSHGSQATIHSMEDSYNSSQSVRGPTSCPLKRKTTENEDVDQPPQPLPGGLPSIPHFLTISCTDYDTQVRKPCKQHVLLDVRVKEQFDLCNLEGAVNIPLADLSNELQRVKELSKGITPVYCICRRGIASKAATLLLHEAFTKESERGERDDHGTPSVYNIAGGLQSWRDEVDMMFPKY